ncbi:hypothetical protein HK098_006806 [Nowakowskiella sp. JEL0407]|nr:hypothetical protein HK098_006806 [Nowakowskiella sp. JEL0407]
MTTPVDVIGYVYCPPGWDSNRLQAGEEAESITKIALETYTDIAYHKEKNAIQISGESQEDVYKAQTALNAIFFPVIVKSKRQWARPDRPGQWGQRRDYYNNGSNPPNHIRKMKSESFLQTQHTLSAPPDWPSQSGSNPTGWR